MKKLFIILLVAISAMNANAQKETSPWTLNTRAWSTNYFTSLVFLGISESVCSFAFRGNEKDSMWAERIIPTPDLVFPIGMGKKGFADPYDIYGPYHRAFGNPFKHIGDYGIGLDISFKPSFLGFYGGAYFKSQEVVFKKTDDNIRGFYFQPRAGLMIGRDKAAVEAGVFYDVLTGCGGSVDGTEKDMLKGGLGLDFGLTSIDKKGKTVLQFSMPLHNFFNTDYAGQQNLKRKVGYIMLTRRISL